MTTSTATKANELQDRLDQLVQRTAEGRHVNSLVVGVRSDDDRIDLRSSGGAAQPDDSYFIASIAKMFTATMVMQLVDEDLVDFDSPIREFLPSVNLDGIHTHKGTDYSGELKIRHLLHQTSGLPDYFSGGLQRDLAKNRDRSYELDDVLEIARGKSAEFPPGDRNSRRSFYSDTNYQLLSTIIENVTGSSLAANLDTRITRPLGLTDTYLYGSQHREDRADPLPLHHRDRQLWLPLVLASERGAGGIVSSVSDQLRFLQAHNAGELFEQINSGQMQQWNRIFFPLQYGYGLMRYRLPRVLAPFNASPEFIGHSGVTGSFAFSIPQDGLHIAGTFNQLDKPSRPFAFISKVATLVTDSPRR